MTLLDQLIELRNVQRRAVNTQPVVIAGKSLPWEDNQNGRMKWYLHPLVENICNAYIVYAQEIAPRMKSGKQRMQGGSIYYLLQGRLRTSVNDEVYEWEAGDALALPILRDGVVVQHANTDEREHALFLGWEANTVTSLGVDKGCGFEQLEPAGPLDKATERRLQMNRGARKSATVKLTDQPIISPDVQLQYHRDIQRWKWIRHRHEAGNLVIRGPDMTWEQNSQGRVRYYLNPEYANNALRDWTLFLHDIKTHTGMHRHQGGIVIYVTEGSGYTLCDGLRYDWTKGDLIVFPLKPEGVEHEHHNLRQGESCQWIATFYWPWWELVASEFTQVKLHPDYRERERERMRHG
jgi:gentisate 1,2-dioxygenase